MILCDVYKSPRKQHFYLYVAKEDGLSRVPDALLDEFGTPEHTLFFKLREGRKLAQEDAARVIENITNQGFHLQFPPPLNVDLLQGR